MPKVFVSHSTKDRTFVEREIISLLNAHGIETWYSRDDIRTADTWLQTIHKGLQSCDWFLVAMSRNSAKSEYVKDEVCWAIGKRWPGRFIPVLIDECEPEDFHLRMPRIQHVDFIHDLEEARKRLLAAWGIQPGTTEAKKKLLGEIEVGQIRKGVVKNIAEFGAFVNLGGIDGLLHITDMDWGRVIDPPSASTSTNSSRFTSSTSTRTRKRSRCRSSTRLRARGPTWPTSTRSAAGTTARSSTS